LNSTREPRITPAVVNIFINYRQPGCSCDGSMWKTEQLNSAAVVGKVTSLTEPRTAVLGMH